MASRRHSCNDESKSLTEKALIVLAGLAKRGQCIILMVRSQQMWMSATAVTESILFTGVALVGDHNHDTHLGLMLGPTTYQQVLDSTRQKHIFWKVPMLSILTFFNRLFHLPQQLSQAPEVNSTDPFHCMCVTIYFRSVLRVTMVIQSALKFPNSPATQ